MSDYTRLTRTDWLGLADRFYARLDGTLASLNGPDWERVTPYLGFRARDVLAHMASTIPVNFREVLDRALAGNPAAPPEFDTFARNPREVARRRASPPAAVLREVRRRLRGPAGGEWTLTVADAACRAELGAPARADVTLEADAEELVAAGQARAGPWVGRLACGLGAIGRLGRSEDVVARITGMASLGWALALRRIRVTGNRALAAHLNRAFWHFWERTE